MLTICSGQLRVLLLRFIIILEYQCSWFREANRLCIILFFLPEIVLFDSLWHFLLLFDWLEGIVFDIIFHSRLRTNVVIKY